MRTVLTLLILATVPLGDAQATSQISERAPPIKAPARSQRPHVLPPPAARRHPATRVAPLPSLVERAPVPPSLHHVWRPGYWQWERDRHVWRAGAWMLPPYANATWVAPLWWSDTRHRWVFLEGYWDEPRSLEAVEVMADEGAPPPKPPLEVAPQPPAAGAAWIGGYWRWNGDDFRWIAGYWELAPPPGRSWEPHRWVGEDGRWRFLPGRWR